MSPTRICILLLLLLTAACRKKDDLSNMVYKITNNKSQPVQVHFYGSHTDRSRDQNRLYSTVVGSRQKVEIPFSRFPANTFIYWDWHTDDFMTSNWRPEDTTSLFNVFSGDGSFSGITGTTIEESMPVLSRKVLLGGNRPETVWKGVQYNNQPMPPGNQYEIVFRKQGDYTFNANGSLRNGRYMYSEQPVGFSSFPSLSVYMYNEQGTGTITNVIQRTQSGTGSSPYPGYGSDSLKMLQNSSLGLPEIMFVRQP